MTSAEHHDYELSSERYPAQYLRLSDEVLTTIQALKDQVMDAEDLAEAQDALGIAHDMLHDEGVLGRSVKIEAEAAIIVSRSLHYDSGQLQPLMEPEIMTRETIEGVFAGCTLVPFQAGRLELAYVVELPLETEALRFRSALIATDDGDVKVETVLPMAAQKMKQLEAVTHTINESGIDTLKENWRKLFDVLEDSEEVDVTFLQELAIIATHIMAEPLVVDRKDIRDMITEIFSELIQPDQDYHMKGMDVLITPTEKGRTVTVDMVDGVFAITGVTTIRDFDFTPARTQGRY